MNKEKLKGIITDTVEISIKSYITKKLISKKKNKKTSFQILDKIIPKERKIRSIVGGLETAMGRTLWEPLAKKIAIHNGFTVKSEQLLAPSNMPAMLQSTIETIRSSRLGTSRIYNGNSSHEAIKHICQEFINSPIESYKKADKGFGVDIWLSKEDVDYFFDTKTVQPNIGSYNKFLSQLLHWYAFYYSKNPSGKAIARIVFPYNPYIEEDFWLKTKNKGFPIEPTTEGLVQDEFWDFLSGHANTFELIVECFEEIHTKGELEKDLDEMFDRVK